MELGDLLVSELAEQPLQAHEGMIGHVESQHIALVGELVLLVPLGEVGDVGGEDRPVAEGRAVLAVGTAREGGEQIELAGGLVALDADDLVDEVLVAGLQGTPGVPQGVEGACLDKGVDGALVAHDGRHLVEEVLEGGELTLLPTGGDDRVDDVDADVAHRGQPEAHVLVDRGELGS